MNCKECESTINGRGLVLSYCPGICLDGLRKATESVRIVGIPTYIRLGHLPNIRQNHYRLCC
jgi:hypothetical protein